MQKRTILIVGGGAAGLMAALFAARAGADVTLLERNEKLGKKIYITGKGRGNLTNTAERDEFFRHILRNPRFFYAAFSFLDNRMTMDLFQSLGTNVKEERGGRVFPESDHASDITRALQHEIARLGVKILLNARVDALLTSENKIRGVSLHGGQEIIADAVIISTGGLSYPSTGSTGDGYRFARDLGHSVNALSPSLTGIETLETWPFALAGLTLKNVCLRARVSAARGKKPLYAEQGELLFTHYGISGPLALTLSGVMPEDLQTVTLEIDLKPALDAAEIDQRLLRDLRALSNKRLITVMDGLAPHSLAEKILEITQISPAIPANAVTQSMRREIGRALKCLILTPKNLRGFSEAVVTRGGVDVREINPSTMESKHVRGLYFAGEVLDLDATTGGYNLQIAFSTGALSGHNAAMDQR